MLFPAPYFIVNILTKCIPLQHNAKKRLASCDVDRTVHFCASAQLPTHLIQEYTPNTPHVRGETKSLIVVLVYIVGRSIGCDSDNDDEIPARNE